MTSADTAGRGEDEGVAGRGTPVVMVHGFLGGAEQWSGQIAALSDRFDVIALDLPGFAKAAGQSAPEAIEAFADHMISALDAMNVGPFVLLGHSMGGMIAQEMAHRNPGRVERLVLYGTGPLGRMPDRFEPLEVSLERLERDGVEGMARRIVATWFVQGECHAGFAVLNRIAGQASAAAARAALLAMAAWDGRSHLRSIDIPTRIIWGDEDRSYRWPQVETLWSSLPQVSLAVVPGASHAAHLEKPVIFDAVLRDFLET